MNGNLISIAGLFLVLLSLSLGPSCSAQTQFIAFHNSTNCGGNTLGTFYTSGSHNVSNSSQLIRSIRVLGLWSVQTCPIVGTCNSTTMQHSSLSGGECKAGYPQLTNGTIRFTIFGDAAMKDSSGINLFSQNNLGGTGTRVLSDTTYVNIGLVRSYWFAGGNSSWLAYPGRNFTGSATCITPDSRVKSQGWGHTYISVSNLNITSIRRVASCNLPGSGASKIFLESNLSIVFFVMLAKINQFL